MKLAITQDDCPRTQVESPAEDSAPDSGSRGSLGAHSLRNFRNFESALLIAGNFAGEKELLCLN